MGLYIVYNPIHNKQQKGNMRYLIIKETHYDNIDNSYDIQNQTEDMDKAIDMLQGYRLIETDKDVSYTMIKYDNEKPFDFNNESEVKNV